MRFGTLAGLIGVILILSRQPTVETSPESEGQKQPRQEVEKPISPFPKKAQDVPKLLAETFIENYFVALNRHDFKAAKRVLAPMLTPKWVKDYEAYWQKFEPGSLSIRIRSITTDTQALTKVRFTRYGKFKGVKVESNWIYWLSGSKSDFRIISIATETATDEKLENDQKPKL
ncbi:MAG: hypothetical protein LH702_24975 [Phormidesmis sp. CAN_BIN44]|nr:hypothetical protein [Phormidesmis sp. CAN_BIN44]